ncbi:hypothetical protein BDF20DRAFT_913639 [Mycotypha africana]|uniref:uncharacterized protein n=1 Tax=Mycotypha africana TaxID=64632 RepID=UPI00230151D4|nr:uncharacterized protein BDF20DRAFT_913639 [Mycotypha africana]KAI8977295.1 hypothetical protein BDF20DRAFT_913639 [Mycotypha africana]
MYQFKIHLENDTLILRGTPEESVGCVLRGWVVLNNKELMKVKSITMSLTGRVRAQWTERNHQHKKEFIILEHHWTFLPVQKKLHALAPHCVYKFPFEYVLPGDLAESMDSNSYGSLSYKLKAIVDRPAFSFAPNLIDRRQLRVIRQIMPSYIAMNPLQMSNEWANKLTYHISVPKKTFYRGEAIPINFSLTPKRNSEQLHVRYLSCFLKEYTTFVLLQNNSSNHHNNTNQQENLHPHTESRIIRFFRDEAFPSIGPHWQKTETLNVPHSFDAVQCDIRNRYFKIEHKLKFTMSLINKYGDLSELRATIPIDIVNQPMNNSIAAIDRTATLSSFGMVGITTSEDDDEEGRMDGENELPTYENSWRSAPYHFDGQAVISPVPQLDYSATTTTPQHHPRFSTLFSPADLEDNVIYPLTPPSYADEDAERYYSRQGLSAATAGDYFGHQSPSSTNSNNAFIQQQCNDNLDLGILPSYHSVIIPQNNIQ